MDFPPPTLYTIHTASPNHIDSFTILCHGVYVIMLVLYAECNKQAYQTYDLKLPLFNSTGSYLICQSCHNSFEDFANIILYVEFFHGAGMKLSCISDSRDFSYHSLVFSALRIFAIWNMSNAKYTLSAAAFILEMVPVGTNIVCAIYMYRGLSLPYSYAQYKSSHQRFNLAVSPQPIVCIVEEDFSSKINTMCNIMPLI